MIARELEIVIRPFPTVIADLFRNYL